VGFDVLTTCQPSTVWCSRERLPAAAAQPAKVLQSCSATDYLLLLILDLGTRWGWVVSVTPRLRFTPGKGPPVPIVDHCFREQKCILRRKLTDLAEIPTALYKNVISVRSYPSCYFSLFGLSQSSQYYCLPFLDFRHSHPHPFLMSCLPHTISAP
jgi:hypothetical protein